MKSLEEKKQRICQNQALAEYFKNKANNLGVGDTQGLLNKLKELYD